MWDSVFEPFLRAMAAEASGVPPTRIVARKLWRPWSNAKWIEAAVWMPPDLIASA